VPEGPYRGTVGAGTGEGRPRISHKYTNHAAGHSCIRGPFVDGPQPAGARVCKETKAKITRTIGPPYEVVVAIARC